jgi:hypothetical protein
MPCPARRYLVQVLATDSKMFLGTPSYLGRLRSPSSPTPPGDTLKTVRNRFFDSLVHFADAYRFAPGGINDSAEFFKGSPMAFQKDAATGFKEEIDPVGGLQSKPPADGLWDCDLTFAGERRG